MAIFSIPSFMAIASAVLKPIPRTSSVSSIRALGHDHGVRAIGLEDARSSVERVASNKFDMGAFEKDGLISITHWRRRG
jgi:hypothetical protein